MTNVVNERLAKWLKTSRKQARVDVLCFSLWLGKEPRDIVTEFYGIERATMIETWKRDFGDYLYSWYKALLDGTDVLVKTKGKDHYTQVNRSYTHNTARRMVYTVASFLRKTCTSVVFENKIPKATETTKVRTQVHT